MPSYDGVAMMGHGAGVLSAIARIAAILFAVVAATLVVYCGMLVYAAATFEHDSLPGPTVLYLVAAGVALAAMLCGGLSHVLWRVRKPQAPSATANSGGERID